MSAVIAIQHDWKKKQNRKHFYSSYWYHGKKRMSFLVTYLESAVLARLGYYFKKNMVTTELWLAMVRSLIRYRMTLANVVFGPTVPGLAPSEVNDIADSGLRRLRVAFCSIAGNVPGMGTGLLTLWGKILLRSQLECKEKSQHLSAVE